MKTKRSLPQFDFCATSLSILEEKIKPYLEDQEDHHALWVPDSPQSFYHEALFAHPPENIDIILFGGFLKRILEVPYWPKTNYRLWLPCQSSLELFEKMIGIPRSKLNLIPRELLFPVPSKTNPFPKKTDPIRLIYGGRISPVKNITGLIYFCHFLQTEHGLNIDLKLTGRFDNNNHEHKGRYTHRDYKKEVLTLIDQLEWKHPPQIEAIKKPGEWFINDSERKIVHTSFSSFMSEDFGVSLAQTQALGMPQLLSQWGAHKDVQGSNIRFIPFLKIPESNEPQHVQKAKAKILATWFVQEMESPTEIITLPSPEKNQNQSLSQKELQEFVSKFVKTWSPEYLAIGRDHTDYFADTKKGRLFFYQYEQIFSSHSLDQSFDIFIYQDEKSYYNEDSAVASLMASSLTDESLLINSYEIGHKHNMLKLSKAQTITLCLPEERIPDVLAAVKPLLSDHQKIVKICV